MFTATQWVISSNHEFCATQNVTYDHRVYNPETHSWCLVPEGGADALLFAGLAAFCACAFYSRLSALWVLCAGAAFQLLASNFNLKHFSNAATIWLGMHPSFLFFQAFLPILLLDSAVRIDFILFKKMAAHVLLFALVNVVASTLAFIPLMLYVLGLAKSGWRAVDAALFGAMLGSTDAVAVTAILKAGGAPEMLSVLLEGESLFNDASSIVLFEVFLALSSLPGDPKLAARSETITLQIAWLAGAGAACGLLMGFVTKLLLKFLHKRHVPPHVEVAVSLAGTYICYLSTEYYVHASGVIAVVVYGLCGAASVLYGLSAKGIRQGAFFKFWDVISFVTNGMVFFFVGASITNFITSASAELFEGGSSHALLHTLQGLPLILAAMFLLRWALMWLEAPLLSVVGNYNLTWQEVLFSTVGGLRGGLALILAQTVLAADASSQDTHQKVVHAQMTLWTSGFVLFTLMVNAPLLGPLMNRLGLTKPSPLQRQMRRRAQAAVARYSKQTVAELQADDDELLKGVDWTAVMTTADLRKDIRRALAHSASGCSSEAAEHLDTYLSEPAVYGYHKPSRKAGLGGSLSVPLLARSTTTWAQRDVDATADLEAGQMLQTPVLNPSEAMFISARVQAQEKRLTEHTMSAICAKCIGYSNKHAASGTMDSTGSSELDAGDSGDWHDEDAKLLSSHVNGEAGPDDHAHGYAAGMLAHSDSQQSVTQEVSQADQARSKTSKKPGEASNDIKLSPLITITVAGGLKATTATAVTGPATGLQGSNIWSSAANTTQSTLPTTTAGSARFSFSRQSSGRQLLAFWQQHNRRNTSKLTTSVTSRRQQGSPKQPTPAVGGAHRLHGHLLSGTDGYSDMMCELGDVKHDVDSDVETEDDEVFSAVDVCLEERRASLLEGLKRHFRFKAAEGLLSPRSLRVLDYAIDAQLMQAAQPVHLWEKVVDDVKKPGLTALMRSWHLQLRRSQAALLRLTGGGCLRALLLPVYDKLNQVLKQRIGRADVVSLEVALELWLALTASPHARMLQQSCDPASALLQEELKPQASAVWQFLIQRQIEEPDDFAALQTYRVQLAVMRRQLAYVERLGETGIVDHAVGETLLEVVERKLHRMESRGPVLQPVSITDVLRRQPFLSKASEALLLWLRAYGELREYSSGQCIVPRKRSGPMGVFLVLAGLIRADVADVGGVETHFIGVGGSVGFIGSVVGRELPGIGLQAAYAQGSALGHGLLVLHLPMRLLDTIKERAAHAQLDHVSLGGSASSLQAPFDAAGFQSTQHVAAGTTGAVPDALQPSNFSQMLLDMHRQAGIMVLDRLADDVTQQFTVHLDRALQVILEHVAALPEAEAHSTLQRLLRDLIPHSNSSSAADTVSDWHVTVSEVNGNSRPGADGAMADDVVHMAVQGLQQRAIAAIKELRHMVRAAEMTRLAAGDMIQQNSSWLLLSGSLHPQFGITAATNNHPTAVKSAKDDAFVVESVKDGLNVSITAPSVLAWGPQLFGALSSRYEREPCSYTAGRAGALLLMAPRKSTEATGFAESSAPPVDSRQVLADSHAITEMDSHNAAGIRSLQRLSSTIVLPHTRTAALAPDINGF